MLGNVLDALCNLKSRLAVVRLYLIVMCSSDCSFLLGYLVNCYQSRCELKVLCPYSSKVLHRIGDVLMKMVQVQKYLFVINCI